LFNLARYKEFKEFQTRILVATNSFERGMDRVLDGFQD
jgi:superfamily II DNA/RNA helicase